VRRRRQIHPLPHPYWLPVLLIVSLMAVLLPLPPLLLPMMVMMI